MKVTNKLILLVEDDQVDTITVTRDSRNEPARASGKRRGSVKLSPGSNSDKPCIMLLDLNMLIMNGIELLKVVKNEEQLKRILSLFMIGSLSQHL